MTKLWESNILRKVVMRIKSGPCVTTSTRVTKFSVGPSASSFLKPNIYDIESFFYYVINKNMGCAHLDGMYYGFFTKILVF